jgi:hypothetical protein
MKSMIFEMFVLLVITMLIALLSAVLAREARADLSGGGWSITIKHVLVALGVSALATTVAASAQIESSGATSGIDALIQISRERTDAIERGDWQRAEALRIEYNQYAGIDESARA